MSPPNNEMNPTHLRSQKVTLALTEAEQTRLPRNLKEMRTIWGHYQPG